MTEGRELTEVEVREYEQRSEEHRRQHESGEWDPAWPCGCNILIFDGPIHPDSTVNGRKLRAMTAREQAYYGQAASVQRDLDSITTTP